MSSAEQSQGLQIQASRLPSPLFALLSKRKYFEHFMGTWGGEEGSGRGFIQEKQPPRRILPRKPKGGGQEGSPLSMAKEEPEGHRSQEGSRSIVHGGRDRSAMRSHQITSRGSPFPQPTKASFPAAVAASAAGAAPEPPAHPFTPTEANSSIFLRTRGLIHLFISKSSDFSVHSFILLLVHSFIH